MGNAGEKITWQLKTSTLQVSPESGGQFCVPPKASNIAVLGILPLINLGWKYEGGTIGFETIVTLMFM